MALRPRAISSARLFLVPALCLTDALPLVSLSLVPRLILACPVFLSRKMFHVKHSFSFPVIADPPDPPDPPGPLGPPDFSSLLCAGGRLCAGGGVGGGGHCFT